MSINVQSYAKTGNVATEAGVNGNDRSMEAGITALENSLLRADFFRLMAICFDEPGENTMKDVAILCCDIERFKKSGRYNLRISQDKLVEATVQTDWQEALVIYHALFTTDVVVSPFEGAYHRSDKGNVIGDIAGFYTAFGLVSRQYSGPPDLISKELGFISWLSLKEAYALDTGMDAELEITRKAVKAFVKDHVARWVPLFADKILLSTDHPWYRAAAEQLKAVLSFTVEEMCIENVHPLQFPAATGEPDQVSCPAAGTCAVE